MFPFKKPGFTKWPKTPRNDRMFRAKLLFWRSVRNSPLCRKVAFHCMNKSFQETAYDPTAAIEALSPQRGSIVTDETVAIGDMSISFDEDFHTTALVAREAM